jgi:hypothetical protein
VIVELGTDEPAWIGPESEAERDRIQQAVGKPPIATDMTVRSTDQFEEARYVIGGVERLVDLEGAVVYSRPLHRLPIPKRSRDRVRNALVRAWLDASSRSFRWGMELRAGKALNVNLPSDLQKPASPRVTAGKVMLTLTAEHDSTRISVVPVNDVERNVEFCWFRSVQQSLTALCVLHQIETSKQDDNESVLDKLKRGSPFAVSKLRSTIDLKEPSPQMALSAIEIVLTELPSPFWIGGFLGTIPREARQWKSELRRR